MSSLQKNLPMSKIKKILRVVFAKVSIKCHLSMRNMTRRPMALDLLREEIKSIILNMVLDEIQAFMVTLAQPFILNFTNEQMDVIMLVLLSGSIRRLSSRLNLPIFTCFEINKAIWLTKKIEAEEYSLLSFLNIATLKEDGICYTNLLIILIENLVIKLSEIIAHLIFSNTHISTSLIKSYCTDPFLLKVNIRNLNTCIYYQSYVTSIVLNLKKSYTQTYSVIVMTKRGWIRKSLYDAEIPHSFKNTTSDLYIIQFLNFIKFLLMKKTLQN